MKIILAMDHGAFHVKDEVLTCLKELGHEVVDIGVDSLESCDYPDYAIPAAKAVLNGEADRAILMCTNGLGMCMVANKMAGIRAALVYSRRTAEATRRHHDSNVICLGAKEFEIKDILGFIRIWLETGFDGGRHLRRIEKFPDVATN